MSQNQEPVASGSGNGSPSGSEQQHEGGSEGQHGQQQQQEQERTFVPTVHLPEHGGHVELPSAVTSHVPQSVAVSPAAIVDEAVDYLASSSSPARQAHQHFQSPSPASPTSFVTPSITVDTSAALQQAADQYVPAAINEVNQFGSQVNASLNREVNEVAADLNTFDAQVHQRVSQFTRSVSPGIAGVAAGFQAYRELAPEAAQPAHLLNQLRGGVTHISGHPVEDIGPASDGRYPQMQPHTRHSSYSHHNTVEAEEPRHFLPNIVHIVGHDVARRLGFIEDIPGSAKRPWALTDEEKRRYPNHTVGYRLLHTLKQAKYEEKRFGQRARFIGWVLSLCVSLQVLFGTLITALAAAQSGSKSQLSLAFLGGFNTVIASVMARLHFMSEPETSKAKVRQLRRFVRRLDHYTLDNGYSSADEKQYMDQIYKFRSEFEMILKPTAQEMKAPVPRDTMNSHTSNSINSMEKFNEKGPERV